MRITFVHMGAESLGVEYLSSVLKGRGHNVELLFDPAPFAGRLTVESPLLARLTDLRSKILRRLQTSPPDIIGLTALTDTFPWTAALAREIKNRVRETEDGRRETGERHNIPILFGGVHTTLCPRAVLEMEAVDLILVGEGEVSLPELFDNLQNGKSEKELPEGIYTNSHLNRPNFPGSPIVTNLDEIPFPDKSIFYSKIPVLEEHYMIISGRGCPFRCTFCCSDALKAVTGGKTYLRRRSVENVIEELRIYKERGRMKLVVFRDDVFTINTGWLEDFRRRYRDEIGIPFFCYTYPGTLNEVHADLLRDAGCAFVTMGVQSADEATRREILRRVHSNETVLRTARLLTERGIKLSIDHIIGIPGEMFQHLEDAARFYNEIRPHRILVFWMTYYPCTEILSTARRQGILHADDLRRAEMGSIPFRNLGGMVRERRAARLQFMLLFALLPLLPRSIATFFINKKLYRLIFPTFYLYNILLFLNAVRIKDTMFFHTIRYAFSRKRAP
ncbi:MAG: radical SAM protein [bacterium]